MHTLPELEQMTKITMYSWQKEFIAAQESNLILCCGRKSGKTQALEFKITLDMANNDFSHTDGIALISSDHKASKYSILKIKLLIIGLGYEFATDLSVAERDGKSYATMQRILLNVGTPGNPRWNKLEAHAAGNTGVTIRRYSFWKIYYDESAYIREDVFEAVSPCLAAHGVQECHTSTPAGNSGAFYDAWFNPDYRRWHIRTAQVGHITKGFLARELRKYGKKVFAQEYEAQFLEAFDGVYPKDLVVAATARSDGVDWLEIEKMPMYMGVDFARFGEDLNSIVRCWFDRQKFLFYIKAETISSRHRTTAIVGKIMHYTRVYPNFRIVVTDEGGAGGGPTDMLIELLGKRKVIGIANQQRPDEEVGFKRRFVKTELHTHLLRRLEDAVIVLDDNPAIAKSLRSMTYDYTMSGHLVIKGINNHIAEAIVRAIFPLIRAKKPKYMMDGEFMKDQQFMVAGNTEQKSLLDEEPIF